MNIVVRPLGAIGRYTGKTVTAAIYAAVWTISSIARSLVKPFTC